MTPVYIFRCPVCDKRFESDEPWEPCCTGPSESRHDHEMTVMLLDYIGKRQVGPHYAQKRSVSTMIQPGGEEQARELLIARG